MSTTTQYAYGTQTSIQIEAIWCSGCGIPYGVPDGFIAERRRDHQSWTCPNGCVRHFPKGEGEEARLKRELEAARSLARRESERRNLAEYQRRAAKGQLTKVRRRVANGVCPCCNRTFKDLGRHMEGQHPEFVEATQ